MYPPPTGTRLSAEQRRSLDDTFLSSDPFGYFSARIHMLLEWADASNTHEDEAPTTSGDRAAPTGAVLTRFSSLLGAPEGVTPRTSPRSVTTQVATDAYAVRHHAAESLVRLTAVLLARDESTESSVWEDLTKSPNRIADVIDQIRTHLDTDDPKTFARLVLCAEDIVNGRGDILELVNDVFADWLQFAIDLLTAHELRLDAAHNKIKHGLAVRARDDLALWVTTTPPNTDGTYPVAALSGPEAVTIFDCPVLDVLAEAPKVDGRKQGLEVTQLRVDVPVVLAEAYMIAWTHGAMFHVAASTHFRGREHLPTEVHAPAHPSYYVFYKYPDDIAADAPVGMRFPLTTPPDGGPLKRPMGIGFKEGFIALGRSGDARHNLRLTDSSS